VAAAAAALLAAAAFRAAAVELQVARAWQERADAGWAAAAADLAKTRTWEVWNIPGYLAAAAVQTGIALYDEGRAAAAFVAFGTLEMAAFGLEAAAIAADGAAQLAAKGAARAAQVAARLADAAEQTAQVMAAIAAREAALAAHDDVVVAELTAAYAKQMARKVIKAARAVVRVLKAVAKKAGRAAVAVAKAAYKYSGAQDVVSCVTDPNLASRVKAAVTVALVVATGGEGEAEVIALDAAEEGGAEQAGADAAESCGGMSFTSGTKVLLAGGKAKPISTLAPGQKVLATNVKTGTTQAEAIAAVLVHHDTDLYDLTIKTGSRTAVIDTTSNHSFWDASNHRWVKAAALRYGTRLRAPTGATAVALGGWAPRDSAGWMWDLTIPGDHDFYIDTAAAPVLVHNCAAVNVGGGSSSTALRSNMESEGQFGFGYQAHHIVPGGSYSGNVDLAASRAVLQTNGVGLDEAVNGTHLPAGWHQSVHADSYFAALSDALSGANSRGDVEAVLRSFANQLHNNLTFSPRTGNIPW
jgi:hypothetical protein